MTRNSQSITGLDTLPEHARPYAERLLGREHITDVTAKVVKAPEGITLVRLSWQATQVMRAGNAEARENVKWAAWVLLPNGSHVFAGADNTKSGALDFALFTQRQEA